MIKNHKKLLSTFALALLILSGCSNNNDGDDNISAPEDVSTAPEDVSTAPEDDGTASEDDGTASVDDGTSPEDDSVASEDNSTDPEDNSTVPVLEKQYSAVIATVATDYTSSDIEIVSMGEETLEATANISPVDLSDYTVAAYGQYFYKIGRYNIDRITKFDIADPTNPIYAFSTIDDINDPTSNPYKLVFLNKNKAYLLRFNSPIAWIVDPSASTQEAFKLGEIDLSAYIEEMGDGNVEMVDGVIADSKLFIAMQRQVWFDPTVHNAYVAVINTSTDEEINTGVDSVNNFKGIPLQTSNPLNIKFREGAGLFVQSVGDYGSTFEPTRPVSYSGGLEKIDTGNYSTEIVVDDGDDADHPYGQINHIALLDEDTGYFVAYHGWQDNALHEFDPSTGTVSGSVVAELSGVDIQNITIGPENRLWVSIGDFANPRVVVIDPENSDAESAISIPTLLNPTAIGFTEL